MEQNGSWHWELSDVGGHFYFYSFHRPVGDRSPHWYKNDYMNCLWGDPTAEKEFPCRRCGRLQAVNISALTQAGMLTDFGGTRSANGREQKAFP